MKNSNSDLLIHACCAHCLSYTYEHWKEKGYSPFALFFNPNIHPYREYKKRLGAVREYCQRKKISLEVIDEYPLADFLSGQLETKQRCDYCYRERLSRCAQWARENGIASYTTTLLISPYQKLERIKIIGEDEGEKNGIDFLFEDLTPHFAKAHEIYNPTGLYSQNYCGCIFSEYERFSKKKTVGPQRPNEEKD